MQNTKFSRELQQHAKGYTVTPSAFAFEKVMQKRESKRRKRLAIFFVAAASIIGIAGLTYFSLLEDNQFSNQQSLTLSSTERNYSSSPIISDPLQNQTSNLNKPNRQIVAASSIPANIVKAPANTSSKNNVFSIKKTNKVTVQHTLIGQNTEQRKNIDDIQLDQNTTTQTNLTPKLKTNTDVLEAEPVSDVSLSFVNKLEGDATKIESTRSVNENKKSTLEQSTIESNTDKKLVASGNSVSDTLADITAKSFQLDTLQQNATKTETKSTGHKWAISALFTPQFINSVYSANSSADLEWFNDYYDNKKRNDQSRFSYNTGIKIERRLNKHFSLSTGVLLSVVKFEELKVATKIDSVPVEGIVGTSVKTAQKTYDRNRFDISFTSLEFPLLVNYNIQHNKLSYQMNAGLSYAYLIATRSLVFDNSDTLSAKETNDAKNSRLQQHHIMLICGANMAYHITPSWSIYAGPVFRYQLNSLYSKDYVIRQNPYYAGLEVGVKYSF